jgi:hypothetical protein
MPQSTEEAIILNISNGVMRAQHPTQTSITLPTP